MVGRTKVKKRRTGDSTEIERNVVAVVEAAETQIEDAVGWINQKVTNNVHGTYLEIGNYLFENFFGGDLEQVKSFNPYKESSFKKLSERDDLFLSKTNLHNAVRVAVQEKLLLPTIQTSERLTYSHRIARGSIDQ